MRAACLAVGIGLLTAVFATSLLKADGPADNVADNVRQIPPPGVEITAEERTELEAGVMHLGEAIARLKLRRDALTPKLVPDVEIFHRAVDQALRFNEFFNKNDVEKARQLLAEGLKRAEGLAGGDHYWLTQTGLVVRGYRSKLDDTVQPYGLVVPASFRPLQPYRYRCDLWFHGRGETSCEVQFIHGRMTQVGQIEPEETFVLHPFGRYSNAFKFAGEVDVFEALDHAQQNYPIDEDRVAVRGFSMGGAGAWHFAVHHPEKFFAANPGAGFSETPEFLKSFQGETLDPPWYEEKLWNLYDCPPWAMNLRLIPTIAYSGEIDKQKQAADEMAIACAKAGLTLLHIIGPETAHKIHPDSLEDMERRLTRLHKAPRRVWVADNTVVDMVTHTLKYNKFGPVEVHALDEHWKAAHVRVGPGGVVDRVPALLGIDVNNVSDLTIRFEPGQLKFVPYLGEGFVNIRGQMVSVAKPPTDGSWEFRVYRDGEKWKSGTPVDDAELQKRHGLQGPIDDAFMDSFLFVTPSGKSRHEAVETWVQSELQHAKVHWRQQMRGDVRIKADTEVTDEDIANHNLILWGDATSNSQIAKVLPQLPITWNDEQVKVGDHVVVDSAKHAPVLIYPNPLNPKKYVVLNSSFTYREYDYLNNARQTPKLPDWAVINLESPPNSRWPGKVIAADFFNERWQVKAK